MANTIRLVFTLAMKDLRLLLRDRVALFWVFGFPVVFALFLGAVVRAGQNGEQARPTVVFVDSANNAWSEKISQALAAESKLVLKPSSLVQARDAVRKAQAVAFVEVLPGLSQSSGQAVRLRLGTDPTRQLEGFLVEQQLLAAWQRVLNPTGASTKHDPVILTESVGVSHLVARQESDYVFPAAVLWGLIGCAACFAISMVTERTRGTFLRLSAAPVGRVTILAGKATACFTACALVCITLVLIASIGFGVQFAAPSKLVLALLSAIVCFVGLTMLLSLLGKSEQAVAGAGWATLIVMAMLGGAMVPLSMMPEWLAPATHLSPVKWSIVAVEGAMWRSFSYSELLFPCSILASTGSVAFALGLRLLSRADT